jgi:RecA/RadA recombinase
MTKKKEDSTTALKELFELTLKSVEKTYGRKIFDIEDSHVKFGVHRYLSTGLPSWDLHLPHNKDRTQYGIPYGRIIEVHGESSSCKTTLAMNLAAENTANGGLTYWCQSEGDFDRDYANHFLRERGVDVDGEQDSESLWAVADPTTLKDLFQVVKGIVAPIREVADKIEEQGGNPLEKLPPVLIVIDSLAALSGDEDRARLDNDWDDGTKVGGHAGEMHRFFKFFIRDFARLGIMLFMTNHYRADLGFGKRTKIPAHESAIRYYTSLRMSLGRGYDKANLNKTVTRGGLEYDVGFPLNVGIYKIRGEYVQDGELSVPYYHNHGFDYLASLIDALRLTGLLNERAGVYEFTELPEGMEEKVTGKIAKKELRNLLRDDLGLAVKLERMAMKRGPSFLEDMRKV